MTTSELMPAADPHNHKFTIVFTLPVEESGQLLDSDKVGDISVFVRNLVRREILRLNETPEATRSLIIEWLRVFGTCDCPDDMKQYKGTRHEHLIDCKQRVFEELANEITAWTDQEMRKFIQEKKS